MAEVCNGIDSMQLTSHHMKAVFERTMTAARSRYIDFIGQSNVNNGLVFTTKWVNFRALLVGSIFHLKNEKLCRNRLNSTIFSPQNHCKAPFQNVIACKYSINLSFHGIARRK